MISWKRAHWIAAALAFGVPLYVYARTVTPTVPFWDSGEFIATSYILGLPHPPGNPVYTMLGRMMTFLPILNIAWRVNFMSSLASAGTAFFTFLFTTRALERTFGGRPATVAQWLMARVGGLVAAFFIAFSSSFWDSAIEAEVYSGSSLMIALVIWLAFRWWDKIGEAKNDFLLVLIPFLLSVSIGLHLGTILVAPGLLVLLAIVRPSIFTSGRFWLSAIILGTFLLLVIENEVHDWNWPNIVFMLLLALIAIYYAMNRDKMVKNNLATWWTLAIVAGFTVQFFLLVRSQQMPHINEGMPNELEMWKDYLLRKQYGPTNPFVRRADVWFQIEHMYLRYVWQQFTLVSRLGSFGDTSLPVRLINVIPYFLFFTGAAWNWKRDKKTFWFFAAQHFIMGPALIFYLNFTDHEVRERDYFFTNSYHFIAIWMGMGATAVLHWVLEAFAPEGVPARSPAARPIAATALAPPGTGGPSSEEAPLLPFPKSFQARAATGVAAASLIGLSLLVMKDGWFEHDRSGFYIAHDYAYNMLVPLEKNGIVFTNGDNDTFPLWYIQEVEHVRTDVRVVNMSLLNTPWYIQQLRDQEPKVPLSYTDQQLATIQPYLDEKTNEVVWVKDQAFADIVKTNQWRKPLYLAVTVPEQEGMEKQLTFEGLVFRIQPKPDPVGMDVQKTYENLYHVYRYRGLLDKNRAYDRTVYKDDNANRLVQNYTAAHVQLATYLLQKNQSDLALKIMEDAVKISPDFSNLYEYLGRVYEQAGKPDLARKTYLEGLRRFPQAPEFHYHVGLMLYNDGKVNEGIAELRRACEISQQFFDWFQALFAALWNIGDRQGALEVLRTWLRAHPDDAQAAAYMKHYEDSLRSNPGAPTPGQRPRAIAP
ncbi:MAG: protein O-mannosyl-transferase family [Bacteroidota bacterium]